jgi:SAM-dependent methyltransferase
MRTEYYESYWEHPQFEDCTYVNWKVAVTREHPIVRAATSVLDVGCGGGAILAAIRQPGVRLAGVEISPEAVRALEKRGFEAAVVDLESGTLPFPDASFDVVLCYDVFEHLFAPESILAEIRRVLKPEGRAFLCVPNTLNGFNRLMFALGRYVDIMDTSHREDATELFSNHIRLFSKELYERFLERGGFAPVEKHYYFPPSFTDPKFKLPSGLAKLVTVPRLHERFPAVMSLGFLYVCKKT